MLLNDRQQKAEALSRELHKLGAFVLNVLPLDDAARGLRVQILDTDRPKIITVLQDWGWQPEYVCFQPRITYSGMQGACVFEIDIPRERPPIYDDRTIRNDIADAEREKAKAEVAAMRKHLGMKR